MKQSYIIVEDEMATARRLKRLVDDSDVELNFLGFFESVDATVSWLISNPSPDLIFMDIQLADGNSFSIFNRVKVKAPVIFTTAYDEFALRAFKVNSIDYLLKPINETELSNALLKWKNIKQELVNWDDLISSIQAEKKYKERILLTKGDRLIPVPVPEILYIHSEDKAVYVMTSDYSRFSIKETLDEMTKQLNPNLFFRANRSFLINREAIQNAHLYFNGKIKLGLKSDSSQEVIVSRERASDFKEWYGN
ncbi:MAG: LytTR family DNA-binding domain-containing protein [Bacteroidia bacterium]